MPFRTNYLHDRESNTYFILHSDTNTVMFDNKTEIIDIAYMRKYLEGLGDDSNIIALSAQKVIRMPRSALCDLLRD